MPGMREGYLSGYFEGVVSKRLSAVEAHPERSNQHEFNGVLELKRLLGEDQPQYIPAHFIWLSEDEQDTATAESTLTWYDARERHPTRSEYRLYFPSTPVSEKASEGDLLLIGKRPDGSAMVIIAQSGSTVENQLLWLFGLPDPGGMFALRDIENGGDVELGFAARHILEALGVEVLEATELPYLENMLSRFGGTFPTTLEFSTFAREIFGDSDPTGNPDATLLSWIDYEERLFRTLERHIVSGRLASGFLDSGGQPDVDEFISFSLSVQNRRKSRAGYALENHLEVIFQVNNVTYARGQETENRAKPDFLFPGIPQYRDLSFPADRLSLLGVKSTCKDRWRQVLSEAVRIDNKHLLTLEPGISENQTAEMQSNNLQLVLPRGLHSTYRDTQHAWLMDLADFISFVRHRQDIA